MTSESAADPIGVALIIPALNEEASIAMVLGAIPRGEANEVIVVDNGSTDRTAEVAAGAGATVLHEPRRGYGAACLTGIAHAKRRNPAIIAFLDGDFSDYPEELPRILAPLREGSADLVIGSRMLGQRSRGAMLPQAVAGNALATLLIRMFWGVRFTDLGPFRAVLTRALDTMRMSDLSYGWTVEMQVKAARLGMRCVEIPVSYRKRVGTSKVTGTIRGTVMASAKILYTIFRHLFVRV